MYGLFGLQTKKCVHNDIVTSMVRNFCPAHSWHLVHGPIGSSVRFYHSLLFFGQTNKGSMWKEALYCFVYEHTAGPLSQACSWQLVSA